MFSEVLDPQFWDIFWSLFIFCKNQKWVLHNNKIFYKLFKDFLLLQILYFFSDYQLFGLYTGRILEYGFTPYTITEVFYFKSKL